MDTKQIKAEIQKLLEGMPFVDARRILFDTVRTIEKSAKVGQIIVEEEPSLVQ